MSADAVILEDSSAPSHWFLSAILWAASRFATVLICKDNFQARRILVRFRYFKIQYYGFIF